MFNIPASGCQADCPEMSNVVCLQYGKSKMPSENPNLEQHPEIGNNYSFTSEGALLKAVGVGKRR